MSTTSSASPLNTCCPPGGSCLLALPIALQRLTSPPPQPQCTGIGAISTFHRTYNLGQVYFLQLFNLDRKSSKQILVSCLANLSFPTLSFKFRNFYEALDWTHAKCSQFLCRHSITGTSSVILLSIGPVNIHPNLPRIAVQLWRGFPSKPSTHSQVAWDREAHRVWEANWTHIATSHCKNYFLIADSDCHYPFEYLVATPCMADVNYRYIV